MSPFAKVFSDGDSAIGHRNLDCAAPPKGRIVQQDRRSGIMVYRRGRSY